MPLNNGFQHQLYPTSPAVQPMLRTLDCIEPADGEFSSLHSTLHFGRVILVHGTFLGDDPLGLAETLKSLGQEVPVMAGPLEKLAQILIQHTRPLTASLAKDLGNYTVEYRDTFQKLVGDDPRIELLEPTWSSQNHHFARAELAVRLLHQLLERPLVSGQRVLLWGHSHAGNAFAILSNLLANDQMAVQKFFDAVAVRDQPGTQPGTRLGSQPGVQWSAVRQALLNAPSPHPLAESVAFATFGTPVRYGWDTSGCSSLVHLTCHRPIDPEHPFLTKPLFPPYLPNEILNATWGDWVQAFAIAGTDVTSVPSRLVNERLGALLEANLPEPQHGLDTRLIASKRLRDVCARWKTGTRCHADGLNLLVDYKPSGALTPLGRPIENSLLGHGVATSLKWLPAHLKLIVEALGSPTTG